MTKLSLTATLTSATTYQFRGEAFGWALCTVNDATGELLITSDWGAWSHRWDPRPSCLGAPTLTAFIGSRGGVDYLADKLQVDRGGGQRWSADATARALRRRLCERRRADGREPSEGLPWRRGPFLTREEARRIWDEIDELTRHCSDNEGGRAYFYAQLEEIDGLSRYVSAWPWEYDQTEQTPEDKALREIVLPALTEACRARATAEVPR